MNPPHKTAITEADVRAVLPAATLEVPVGAVVTPAARDLAKKLGVAIIEVAHPSRHSARHSDKHAETAAPAPVAAAPPPPPAPAPPAPAPAPAAAPPVAQLPAPAPAAAPRAEEPRTAPKSETSVRAAVKRPAPEPPPGKRVVAIGADHGGLPMKAQLKPLLGELGYEILDLGTMTSEAVDYPDFAVAVARAVAEGRAWRGIMVDGAGIGSAMAANKIAGVRAALCYDVTSAGNAREHNDANVLTLGGTLIGQRLAADVVKAFLATEFGGGRHQKRVDKINALDSR